MFFACPAEGCRAPASAAAPFTAGSGLAGHTPEGTDDSCASIFSLLYESIDIITQEIRKVKRNFRQKSENLPCADCSGCRSGETRAPRARQRVKKAFLTRWQVFQTFRKSLKNFLIEREGGFLPPSLFPRCSVSKPFSFVF